MSTFYEPMNLLVLKIIVVQYFENLHKKSTLRHTTKTVHKQKYNMLNFGV